MGLIGRSFQDYRGTGAGTIYTLHGFGYLVSTSTSYLFLPPWSPQESVTSPPTSVLGTGLDWKLPEETGSPGPGTDDSDLPGRPTRPDPLIAHVCECVCTV